MRVIGKTLGIDSTILGRHPFPGPGLGIRILGDITAEKVRILQEVDSIFVSGLREHGLYDKVWQAGAMLLPIQSVGVMGDERTYERGKPKSVPHRRETAEGSLARNFWPLCQRYHK